MKRDTERRKTRNECGRDGERWEAERKETECRGNEASGREGACGLELREIRVPVFWNEESEEEGRVWNTAESVADCECVRGLSCGARPCCPGCVLCKPRPTEVPETTDVDGT